MAAKSASVCQGAKPKGWGPHRYLAITSPEMSNSTSDSRSEVLLGGCGEGVARLRRDYRASAFG